jgi:hypothetical protein
MREDFYAYMYEAHGVCFALVDGLGRYRARTMEDLRGYVLADADQWAKAEGEESAEVLFGLSARDKAAYPLCRRCSGTGQVESKTLGAAQYTTTSGTFDWTRRAPVTCNSCEGTGVRITGFGRPEELY